MIKYGNVKEVETKSKRNVTSGYWNFDENDKNCKK